MTARLRPPHPRALIRALAATSTRSAIFAAVLSWWFWPWGLLSLLFVPLSMFLAHLDHRHQGWLLSGGLLVSRRGWLNRRTWLLALSKLQSTAVSQGPILRRYGLGIVQVRVAGSVVSLPAMTLEEALELQIRLSRGRRG